MKVSVNEEGGLVLKEIYSGVLLQTKEGNEIGICMRDDTFEINVINTHGNQWHRVNCENLTIAPEGSKNTTTIPNNRWKIVVQDEAFIFTEGNEFTDYYIDFNRCDTAEKLLKWINHMSEKTWVTKELLVEFTHVVCKHLQIDLYCV